MREVTVANISHYRRPSYKVIVQQISPSSLLQRMADAAAAAFTAVRRERMPAYATVTPIDLLHARRSR